MADDFQFITGKLRSALDAVGLLVVIGSIVPLAACVISLLKAAPPPTLVLAVLVALFAFGVLHLVAAEFAHARWGMQMAITLAAVWMMLAVAAVVVGLLAARAGTEGWPVLLVPAAVMGWGASGGLRTARRAMKSLDADEGWNSGEPAKPKGFEPILLPPDQRS